jgi:hypothetical protein
MSEKLSTRVAVMVLFAFGMNMMVILLNKFGTQITKREKPLALSTSN